MQVLVNYNFVIHLLCLKVTSAHVTCIMSQANFATITVMLSYQVMQQQDMWQVL